MTKASHSGFTLWGGALKICLVFMSYRKLFWNFNGCQE